MVSKLQVLSKIKIKNKKAGDKGLNCKILIKKKFTKIP